jgi:ABC-2 type transport system permease protein
MTSITYPLRKYWSITSGWFMANTVYAGSLFFTFISNVVYIVVVYFLWQKIYNGAETLHGMTFNDTFIYLTLAGSMFIIFRTWIEWSMSRQIIDGSIITHLVRPVDYQLYTMAISLGQVLFQAVVVSIPSLIIVLVVFHANLPFGWNLIFFPISLAMAYILSFTIDYMIGLTAFYTESIWGISTTKDVIVSVLSGALIPLQFFPESFQKVLQVLPFQAIYNTPLKVITSANLTFADYAQLLGVQLLWIVILFIASRLFYQQAIKVLTVNGG